MLDLIEDVGMGRDLPGHQTQGQRESECDSPADFVTVTHTQSFHWTK